eukprot:975160-Pelagomonas_calceolata.AAC.1
MDLRATWDWAKLRSRKEFSILESEIAHASNQSSGMSASTKRTLEASRSGIPASNSETSCPSCTEC